MPTKRAKEIALAFPRGAHQEVFINGVLRYAADHDCNWSYITAPESLALSVLDLHGWRGDGIIAAINTSAEADCVAHLPMPIVNISGTLPQTPVPRVSLDNRLVGQMAAEHLIERGFTAFAYYGLRNVAYSAVRQEAFEARLQQGATDGAVGVLQSVQRLGPVHHPRAAGRETFEAEPFAVPEQRGWGRAVDLEDEARAGHQWASLIGSAPSRSAGRRRP